jgi:hypothetical protein
MIRGDNTFLMAYQRRRSKHRKLRARIDARSAKPRENRRKKSQAPNYISPGTSQGVEFGKMTNPKRAAKSPEVKQHVQNDLAFCRPGKFHLLLLLLLHVCFYLPAHVRDGSRILSPSFSSYSHYPARVPYALWLFIGRSPTRRWYRG